MELKSRRTLLNENIKQTVTLDFFIDDEKKVNETISFDLIKRDKLSIKKHPNKPLLNQPLFFPAKEVLSLFANFTTLYEKYELSFDETYYDLCKAIDNPLLKNPNEDLILKIEPILGGKIILKANNFYLQTPKGEFNIFMIAEGLRKFGMLSYLIANDSLKKNNIIFWDEPEANLNPKLIKQLASFLVELTKYNIQIIIATHNLFLMKYFDYLINHSETKIPTTFFSLTNSEQGTQVEQSERLSQLNSIAALDEELALYDKEQEAIYAEI
jgi:predicted ATPase